MRRSLLAFVQATCLFLIALVLWAGSERWVTGYSDGQHNSSEHPGDSSDVALPGQWVARTLQGDLFFDIPPEDASWNSAWNLFWNDAATRDRYNKKLPFQVGEPTLFCKDLWWAGYGRIAVVPSVNLEYSDEAAKKIKDLKGYTSWWWTEPGEDREDRSIIQWVEQPPETVKCVPTWEDQSWRPWNESLS
ncbi:putative glycosyltransferase family 69 protein [Eutypa lata UCREL1]|uniref:Putative glycosyltransferase family 69 protein n=1 Tax=Eutypa lata (strain UCR-EL1) TaxID=1287681 RepID=M7TCF9_EUTLA|nr:putative glycosyltransferase family 69 protein [Eutypa lata UCREL1]